MPTNVPIGSALAVKLYSVALFAESQRKHSFKSNMTGPAPKQPKAETLLRSQTSSDYPFVVIRDLQKGQGDQVSVDLFNVVNIRPTMGDKKITGRLGSLSFSSMDIRVDQSRFGVDTGGRMTQHRTLHNLRGVSKANLVGLNARYEDQLSLIHVAGSRGYQNDNDWVVPLASDPEFASIVVNPITPPTFARRLIAGGGTSVTAIGTSDFLTLQEIDRVRAIIDDMPFPLQPIRLANDPGAEENPLYCLYVSSRQWHYLQTSTAAGNWRTFLQNAWERAKTFSKGGMHPLFTGNPGMWNGILIKKINRAIRFAAADVVAEYNSSGAIVNTAAPEPVDRAVLLGAQAMSIAYGKHGGSGTHYNWHEELTDHGNVLEVSTACINGYKKVIFTDSDGVVNDHGVMTIDSYAPAIS